MPLTPRHAALQSIAEGHPAPSAPAAISSGLPEYFGSKVFNDAVQRRRLPKAVYKALRRTLEIGAPLDVELADSIASAMKDWALEHGATHYTHWFQPMHGLTAEKHDAFLSPTLEGGALQEFSGKELILGEPDASSFPSGGVRNTFEARGYTGWDPGSPAFLRETEFGSTLTIPTVFASWTGEALDTKTPLLRSCEALDRQARRLLTHLGGEPVAKVSATVGPEQEYFLVDRRLHRLRPDLHSCGRTVLGARPPKGQELEDHYFSLTPRRILNFMMDLEFTLWELGVPVKTRHTEVAPHQFELAPFYEAAALATDHNMLTMEVLPDVAARHGLKTLLHEKPFVGVNGSGKHVNWAMATDSGDNLLKPGKTPHENLRFMTVLAAVVRGVDTQQELLRATIASAGNDHRLGANEAPPAIISVFLGEELQEVVDALIEGRAPKIGEGRGSEPLNLGVTSLPPLPIDTSDRNRTSPFAFTGFKFEFRAAGSGQSIAFPVTVINTMVADSMDYLSGLIESRGGDPETIAKIVRETLAAHQRILFSGDNYSEEWRQEAAKRGLANHDNTPAALAILQKDETLDLFDRHNVMTRRETASRATVLYQAYAEGVVVEALTLNELARTSVLPVALRYQRVIADAIKSTAEAGHGIPLDGERALLAEVSSEIQGLMKTTDELARVHHTIESGSHEAPALASAVRGNLVPAMAAVRAHCDKLESLVDDELWPLPKYRELLFAH
ncbi:glutamine synthetase III [Engelhardtia mirabilis]|uniref:Glutamine synthetase n=1 Tax=Engelhardtia mirabilis TaxID=2528011 RepID=A0A518BL15_9BACT|nr:Glutamine synthetase [Planctomycetes bacterium Pla133]QDV01969.1 Glutamine synthetase [Planctomycetes bacterium Pla86]